MSDEPIPALYAGLIDDAALFPPGNAPMADGLAAHAEHRRSWYSALVGPFLCPDTRLVELRSATAKLREIDGDRTLGIGLIVTGGAGAIEPAVTWVERAEELELRGIEIALRDEPEPGRNARRIALALQSAGVDEGEVPVSVEVPVPYEPPADPSGTTSTREPGGVADALDALAEAGHRAKLRTGTPDGAAPSPERVARFLRDCLDRELPFKCTAGLHHAVRAEDCEQHGFLNLLAATRAGAQGAGETELIRALAETDPLVLQSDLGTLDEAAARSTRRWFTSFGSCSIAEPLAELAGLELVREPA